MQRPSAGRRIVERYEVNPAQQTDTESALPP